MEIHIQSKNVEERNYMGKVWFDPHNIEHCKAYRHLQKTGQWPEGFELHDVESAEGLLGQASLMGKMTKAWIDQVLESENANKAG